MIFVFGNNLRQFTGVCHSCHAFCHALVTFSVFESAPSKACSASGGTLMSTQYTVCTGVQHVLRHFTVLLSGLKGRYRRIA